MNKKDSLLLAVLLSFLVVAGTFLMYGLWISQPSPTYPRQAIITIENGMYTAIYPVTSTTWWQSDNGTGGFYYAGPRFQSSNFTEVLEWAINQTKP